MKNFALLAFISLSLLACRYQPEPIEVAISECEFKNRIDLSNPQIGQRNRYLMFESEDYSDTAKFQEFAYLPDTLVVEMVRKEANEFIFREYFTAGSVPIHVWGNVPFIFETNAIEWRGLIQWDTFYIDRDKKYSSESRLFFTTEARLPFKKNTKNETIIEGWKTHRPYCECDEVAFAKNSTILGQFFPFLNIHRQDRQMATDGEGRTTFYDPACTIARVYSTNPWTNCGYGFDLLP